MTRPYLPRTITIEDKLVAYLPDGEYLVVNSHADGGDLVASVYPSWHSGLQLDRNGRALVGVRFTRHPAPGEVTPGAGGSASDWKPTPADKIDWEASYMRALRENVRLRELVELYRIGHTRALSDTPLKRFLNWLQGKEAVCHCSECDTAVGALLRAQEQDP